MKTYRGACVFILLLFAAACGAERENKQENKVEKIFLEAELVDAQGVDKTISVDLVNSDPKKNYFGEDYYGGLNKAYLRLEVAAKLARAQKTLRETHPEYSLLVLDAARPRSVSALMFAKMKGTKLEKYVADPARGSMHNYGIAVDMTIADSSGRPIDMGFTPFYKSPWEIYWQYLKVKLGSKPTPAQEKNRRLLTDTMLSAGFIPLPFEWWHFEGMTQEEARATLKIIE